MSHQPERQEKNCLNCGTEVQGRYCHLCGQENIVPHQSFPSLVRHFIYDIFHFDGKFFDTLKYLLIRPGFVPREYVMGKRSSYLDPIRMYLFTSAIFFLLFFSFKPIEFDDKSDLGIKTMTIPERYQYAGQLDAAMRRQALDSGLMKQMHYVLDSNYRIYLLDSISQPTDTSFRVSIGREEKMMVAEKLTARDSLKQATGNNWIDRAVESRWTAYRKKYGDDTKGFISDLLDSLIHKFPYMLFISLPFFAGILKLLYVRRKRFFYSDHAVFTLYQYIFTFILLLFYFLLKWLGRATDVGLFSTIGSLVFISGGVYLFLGMKRFYEQGGGRTFVKFLLLNILAIVVLVILMLFFFFISVFQI